MPVPRQGNIAELWFYWQSDFHFTVYLLNNYEPPQEAKIFSRPAYSSPGWLFKYLAWLLTSYQPTYHLFSLRSLLVLCAQAMCSLAQCHLTMQRLRRIPCPNLVKPWSLLTSLTLSSLENLSTGLIYLAIIFCFLSRLVLGISHKSSFSNSPLQLEI